MSDRTVRFTIEFDIDEEALQEHRLQTEDVYRHLVFCEDDVVDGFCITTDIPGMDRTSHFFLCNGRVTSQELTPVKSVELKELEEMVREDLHQHGVDGYGLDEREARALIHHNGSISLLANEAMRYLSDQGVTTADALNYAFTTLFQNILDNFRDEFTISVVRAGEYTFQDIWFYDLEQGDMVLDRSGWLHTAAADAVPEKDYVVGTDYMYLGVDNLTGGQQGALYEVPCTISVEGLRDYEGTAYFNPRTGALYNLSCQGLQRGDLFSCMNMGKGTLRYNGLTVPFHQDSDGKHYVSLLELAFLEGKSAPSRLEDRIDAAKERQSEIANEEDNISKTPDRQ